MKKIIFTPIIVLLLSVFSIQAQDWQEESLGLPGDNLNLYAVMKLFQESETLEGFERKLNEENARINNLDLNGDNMVDYIRVIDNVDRDLHNIVLQVAINQRETQDVAVFTVWKDRNGETQVQLIGDEALYGRNYIIEPIVAETPNPGYSGNSVTRTTFVTISAWPVIRYIYMPNYIVWHSPWYYSYYPHYWRPWRPFYWDYYYGYHYHYNDYYYGHYHHYNEYRYPQWNRQFYTSRRTYSPYVHQRIEEGHYKTTYSHPEQRREGSAMYYRSHPEQKSRNNNSADGNSVRRTSSGSRNNHESVTTDTYRKSTTSGSQSRSTSGSGSKSTTSGSERRSTSTGTQHSGSGNSGGQKSTGTHTDRQSGSSGSHETTKRTSNGKPSGSSSATKSEPKASDKKAAPATSSTRRGSESHTKE